MKSTVWLFEMGIWMQRDVFLPVRTVLLQLDFDFDRVNYMVGETMGRAIAAILAVAVVVAWRIERRIVETPLAHRPVGILAVANSVEITKATAATCYYFDWVFEGREEDLSMELFLEKYWNWFSKWSNCPPDYQDFERPPTPVPSFSPPH
jgi:hypothetical protein